MAWTFLLLAALACNLPAAQPSALPAAATASPTAFIETQPPALEQPFSISHAAITVPASLALPPADLPFQMDCSALDPSRQPECDSYLASTRDIVYPFYRQLLGASLSDCYDAVSYRIVPDEALAEHQGEASDNHITYSLRSTLDLNAAPLYDSHEILHVIGFCNGALDQHIFHGALEAHVDLTLTGFRWQTTDREHIVQWLETKRIPELNQLAQAGQTGMPTATPAPGQGVTGTDLRDACNAIFKDLVTVLYYDAGITAIQQVYHGTIQPAPAAIHPALKRIYGEVLGAQVQIVVNSLKQNPLYPIHVPPCGIE